MGAGFRSVERLRFLASDESGSRGGAEFGEQGQWCGATFDGAGFHAIRTVGDAMRVAVENSQRDQTFAGADADQRRDGRENSGLACWPTI